MIADAKAMEPVVDDTTSLLKALAHPARLLICCQLRQSEMSVGEIETTLDIRQPRLSRELGKLRDEGLVETRRESKVVFYRLADSERIRSMIDAICAVMLGQPISTVPAFDPVTPQRKPNPPGGYGVFARTKTQS